jgi:hypothetical protein
MLMKPRTGVIRVPEITWARWGCWWFVASGSEVCIPTRERGNELKCSRKFSEKMNAEITSENAKYDVVTSYSKWQEVVS